MQWLLLFAGGGLGAIARYALGLQVAERVGAGFPWGTLAVNVLGCLGIGVAATLADEHVALGPSARLFVVTGLLGGFTTFSTFGLETWQLVEQGRAGAALGYAAASFAAGLGAIVIALRATRALA